MDCITQIIFAERKQVIQKSSLKETIITPFKECLDRQEIKEVRKLSDMFKLKECLDNAAFVMEKIGAVCCEGVAYIIMEGDCGKKWIKHCWNKKGDKYFDVTEEFCYRKTKPSIKDIHYFLLRERTASDYAEQKRRVGVSGFSSDIFTIEEELNKINIEVNGGNDKNNIVSSKLHTEKTVKR